MFAASRTWNKQVLPVPSGLFKGSVVPVGKKLKLKRFLVGLEFSQCFGKILSNTFEVLLLLFHGFKRVHTLGQSRAAARSRKYPCRRNTCENSHDPTCQGWTCAWCLWVTIQSACKIQPRCMFLTYSPGKLVVKDNVFNCWETLCRVSPSVPWEWQHGFW